MSTLSIADNLSTLEKFPKNIYCFWNSDELPFMIKRCLENLKKIKDWKVECINKKNAHKYFKDKTTWEEVKDLLDRNPTRFSDHLRLEVLSNTGGVWMDISSFITNPDFLNNEILIDFQNNIELELWGYSLPGKIYPYKSEKPILESWFIGCRPGSKIIKKWRDEFLRSKKDFKNINDYLKEPSVKNVAKNIPIPSYLTIHVAFRVVTENIPVDIYLKKIKLTDSLDGPFLLHHLNDWNNKKIGKLVYNIINLNKYDVNLEKCKPFIKLRGDERRSYEKYSKKIYYYNLILFLCLLLVTIFMFILMIYKYRYRLIK